jgi:ubiquitin carboxyl-terminal hydrolase 1
VKKTPFVQFPSVLDITDFTTSGVLYTDADGPISRHATPEWPTHNGSAKAGPVDMAPAKDKPPKMLYRLEALICHYGFTHSFGHFVAYRRKPTGNPTWARPRKACPDYCECQDCAYYGQVRGIPADPIGGWLRISDADVETVTESAVLAEQGSAFLLFYEKVLEYDPALDMLEERHGGTEEPSSKQSKAATGGTVNALMDEMKRKGGDDAMRRAWARA